jgi:cell division protein FtsB
MGGSAHPCSENKMRKSVFQTTLTLEERIARAQTQLAKAKENRRKAYEKAAKAEKRVERLIAKRQAGKPEIVDAKPAAVQEVARSPDDDERRT